MNLIASRKCKNTTSMCFLSNASKVEMLRKQLGRACGINSQGKDHRINSESIRRHTMFEQCVACENNISLLSSLLYSKYSVTLKKNRRSPRKINSNSITYHRCSCNHSLQGNTPVFSVVKV